MYRLLSPKKRPDREVEACCMLSKDVDTPGPKNLVRALEDYKLEQDQSFGDWVKTILMLLEEGNPIGDGGEGLAGGGKTYETTPVSCIHVESEATKYMATGKSSVLSQEETLFACSLVRLFACSPKAAIAAVECFIAD
ncbi:hypothetical protein FOC1_g10008381 [Fusarium oxysporum f. sp. cubense race 1]|uniref:Uncharacterized protein n=1 Tax=Fusarium oxysporum f. sp. cubense (strain race 1) TaxID=1229664 RepID=N4UQE0_FUSC1|nr:hypothetical protein FOC1_g10008381 [Fusarium oxysporum f. sp. cubense race 1]